MQAVFMIGTQRSGSNLLRLMLGQSSFMSAPHPPHLISVFTPLLPHYQALKNDANWDRLCGHILAWTQANPVPWPVELPGLTDLKQGVPQRTLIDLVLRLYDLLAKQEGSTHWCNKSLANVYQMEGLSQSRPDAKYLHIVRDGRDVYCSFQNTMVGPKHPYFVAYEWAKAQEKALFWQKSQSKGNYFRVHYEDLIQHTRLSLTNICAFLGIPFEEKMLHYYQSKASQVTAESGRMWLNVGSPIQRSGLGRYRRDCNKEEIRIFEEVAGPVLNRLGYESEYPITERKTFTEEEIREFKRKDLALRRLAKSRASREDIARRREQEKLWQILQQE